MRLKPSEVRIVNAIRALTPQSKIYISKHESGDLNVQTHERFNGQGQAKGASEVTQVAHRVQLRD